MRKFFTLFFLIAAYFTGVAQTGKGRVAGTLTDGQGRALEAATLSLLRGQDSSLVKVALSDKSGKFSFEEVAFGNYLVSASALGHEKAFSSPFALTEANASVVLATLGLQAQAKTAAGVVVTARRPLVEQKIDRTVVNVEASVTNVGSSALDVLEKSPGLSVDKDGNISLKGKAGVIVLVDGRPTQLSGPDLANLLRNMQAAQLDQIEIMTNPPARFDAAGNAGVINIKTKKNKQFGYNGAVNLGYSQGRYPRHNESVNFNYRQGKWNLFTNFGYSDTKRFQDLYIQRNFRDPDSKLLLSYFDQQARMINRYASLNGKLGVDFFAGPKTTLGMSLTGFHNPAEFLNRNTTDITNEGGLGSQTRALTSSEEIWQNLGANLNFRRVIDSTGRELTGDLDYLAYSSRSNMNMINAYFNAWGNALQKADTLMGALPQDISIYSGKLDYLHPLKKDTRFEAGIKSSWVQTDNNARYDSMQYGKVIPDLGRSNHFIYEEMINAAYVNLSGPLSKKLNGQLGLRLENTIARGNQLTTDTQFTRRYTQLFPTAFLQYKMNEQHNLALNYGRRIRRPNYESLNPFIEFLDRYTYQQGNPDLKPQFSHNIELSHTFKSYLTATLNYTRTTDIIQQVMEQNESTNETFVRRANIASERQYGLALSFNKPLNKWWTSSIYVNGFNNRSEGTVDSSYVAVSAYTIMINGSQQFKLGKTTSAEVSGFYRTGGLDGVLGFKPMGMVSVGFSQQVLKNKGSIRLNVRDLFFTQRFRAVIKYGNVDTQFQSINDSRTVNLSFTYRFSKGKMNGGPKRRASSANDEQNRVGVGN